MVSFALGASELMDMALCILIVSSWVTSFLARFNHSAY